MTEKIIIGGGEDLGVDGIAQGRDQGVDPALHLLQDQDLGRRLDLVVDLELPALLPQAVERLLADVARRVDPEAHRVSSPRMRRRASSMFSMLVA